MALHGQELREPAECPTAQRTAHDLKKKKIRLKTSSVESEEPSSKWVSHRLALFYWRQDLSM